jgi:predicted PurR-regulated permease PerM
MPEASPPLFSPVQRRVIGFATAFFAFLLILVMIAVVVHVLGRALGIFGHIIWPLAVAGILALVMRPLVGVIERRLSLSRIMSVVVIYFLVTIVITVMLLLLVPMIVEQIVGLVNAMPELWQRAHAAIVESYPRLIDLYNRAIQNEVLANLINSSVTQIRELAMSALPNLKSAGGTVMGIVGFITSLATVPVFLFFFLQSDEDPARRLDDHLPFLTDEKREDVIFLVREFLSIIVAFFRGQLLIGLIMGVLLAIGFTLAGLQFGTVFGLLAGLLNIVPYLGTIIGLSAVLPTAYLQPDGGFTLLAICLGVFILVQTIEGYYLTPRIMGERTGLHPVTIIIAIFFWGTALKGVLGMILAIPLTAFLVTVWRLAKRKYIRKVV